MVEETFRGSSKVMRYDEDGMVMMACRNRRSRRRRSRTLGKRLRQERMTRFLEEKDQWPTEEEM